MRTTSSQTVYRNPWMTVREDRFELADGSPGLYGVVEKQDFALILPVEDGGFHLVEQYRYAVGERLWEFPQGSWPAGATSGRDGDAQRLDLAESVRLAASELREETGLTARSWSFLGSTHVAHGYSAQRCHVFRAAGLDGGAPDREATESDMRQRWVAADELDEMVAAGRFSDSSSLAGLALLRCPATRPVELPPP